MQFTNSKNYSAIAKKGSIYLLLSSIVFIFSAYLINVVLGKYLGPIEFGKYNLVIVLMTVINVLQLSGVPQAVSKFVAENPEHSESILKSGLILQLTLTMSITLVFYFISNLAGTFFHDPSLAGLVRLSALILPPYGIFALYIGYYNGLHNFRRQSIVNITYSIAKTVGVIGLGLLLNVRGALLGFIFAPCLALLLSLHIPNTRSSIEYGKLLKYSLPLVGFSLLSILLMSADLFIVKAILRDSSQAGYYGVAQNISSIPYYALSAFATVLFPSISRVVAKKDHKKAQELIASAIRTILVLLVPGVVLLSVGAKSIVQLTFSFAYAPASVPLSILVFGFGALTIFSLLANIISGSGRPDISMIIAGTGVAVSIIACTIFVPLWGLKGAAFSTSIGSSVALIISAVIVDRQFGPIVSNLSLFKILGSGVVIYLIGKFQLWPVWSLPILGIFYICLLGILGEIDDESGYIVRSIRLLISRNPRDI